MASVYSRQEWDQMEENFTAQNDGGLIMKEELDAISYYKKPYTVNDVFIENTESEFLKNINESLREKQLDKHIQGVLYNLPLPMHNVLELNIIR